MRTSAKSRRIQRDRTEGAHSTARLVKLATAAALLIATVVGVDVTTSPAGAATHSHASRVAASTQGACGYGQGAANPGALCWLNMSTYNPFLALSTFGQRMTLPVGGGYTMSFTVTDHQVGSHPLGEVQARNLSTLSGAWLGVKAYRGTPGRPALYQNVSGGMDAVGLSDISVTNSAGQPLANYNLVVAGAESTDGGGSSLYLSDKPLSRLNEQGDSRVCSDGLHGLGTQVVSCDQPNRGDHGNFFLEAENPRNFDAVFQGRGFSGIAFGLRTSRVTLIEQVAGRRKGTDAFDIWVYSFTKPQIPGRARTGSGNSATLGPINLDLSGNPYTLSVTPALGSGTNLKLYNITWSCTNNGSPYSVTRPPGLPDNTAVSISPNLGDNIVCTVTNSLPVVSGSYVTPEAGVGAAVAVAGLLGLRWRVRHRRHLAN